MSVVKIRGRSYVWAIHRCYGNKEKKGTTNHLYRGTFGNIKHPLCKFGWSNRFGLSIFRGKHGVKNCKICIKMANQKSNTIPKNPHLE